VKLALKHFPTLERVLKSSYPFLDTEGWIEDEFPETGDTSYETECDNFPIYALSCPIAFTSFLLRRQAILPTISVIVIPHESVFWIKAAFNSLRILSLF